jgi:UPF0716 protein FxsA
VGLIFVLLFIALPIAEIYVIIKVGEAIGAVPTIALLILDSLVGAALLRSQGRQAWMRFNRALAEGRIPAREVFDGAMVILGGALLLTPGFITDVFGLLLLIPATRALWRGLAARSARRHMSWRVAAWGSDRYDRMRGPGPAPGSPPPARPGSYDYEGSAREVNEDELTEGERNGR